MWAAAVDAACGSIHLPKTLEIKNMRLGVLFRLLQVAVIPWVLYNSIALRAWNITTVPIERAVSLWVTFPTDEEEATTETPAYCTDPSSMDYAFSSKYKYKFSGCEQLPDSERVWLQGTNLFVPFSFQDEHIEQAKGAAACQTLSASCTAVGERFKAFGEGCSCTRSDEKLSKDVEGVRLHFNHGYHATFSTGERIRGQDRTTREIKKSPKHQWQEEPPSEMSEMVTIVRNEHGTRCKVGAHNGEGAKDVWDAKAASQDGVQGTISEWLACAGITLNDDFDELGSGDPTEEGEPKGRVTGLVLYLEFAYYNKAVEGHDIDGYDTVCYLTVSVIPQWNSMYTTGFSIVPHPETGAGAYRSRKAHGMGLKLSTTGRLGKFNYNAVITLFVHALVLLSLPSTVIALVANYGCGLLSNFYHRAAVQVLEVQNLVTGLSARILAGTAAFSSLVGAETGTDLQKKPMDSKALEHGLRQALCKESSDGRLDDAEFKILVESVLRALDTARNGTVSADEFVSAYSSNEIVSPKEMAQLFDNDRKKSVLEKLFTSSDLAATLSGKPSAGESREVKPVFETDDNRAAPKNEGDSEAEASGGKTLSESDPGKGQE